ncbi:hypothetical protein [Janthinobacterium sp. AD80]|uniref:hypothetical protein n=1 Tax=Janthinobacterium sp. AD80 TaxID=1528773 RepID=UPI000CC32F55|nr:hypothetical protein [Janthinobacterium sp. AD80]PMQ17753.1 hypothetical protein JaAD80_03830 [Janthinobacterium sp. AD80]
MHSSPDAVLPCQARRRWLLGAASLAAVSSLSTLAACGGGARTWTVTDRQVGVAPGVSCMCATGHPRPVTTPT